MNWTIDKNKRPNDGALVVYYPIGRAGDYYLARYIEKYDSLEGIDGLENYGFSSVECWIEIEEPKL